jgi:hypothetical protein
MPHADKRGIRRGLKKLSMSVSSTGYHRVASEGGERYVHRIVARQYLPDWDASLEVDHVNGDKLDNRVENLRMATKSQQAIAFQSPRGGSSKYRGVSFNKEKRKYEAYITLNGATKKLGYFADETMAARAWNEAAIKLGFKAEALNNV